MTKTLQLKEENIAQHIFYIRGEKVMLDINLAQLYSVETKVLKQAVRRNIKRFPSDFMFELTLEEYKSLRLQFVTLKRGQHSKYPPFAFTEQGVAMLSGILNSDRAIEVNIAIMRTFVQLRKLMDSNKDLARKVDQLEQKYDGQFQKVFTAIKKLVHEKNKPRPPIGFQISQKNKKK